MKKQTLLALLAFTAAAAMAQTPAPAASAPAPITVKPAGGPPPGAQQQFPLKKADLLKRISDEFDAVDADKNGIVTAEEMKAFREARRAEYMKKMEAARAEAKKKAEDAATRAEAEKRGVKGLDKTKGGPIDLTDPTKVKILGAKPQADKKPAAVVAKPANGGEPVFVPAAPASAAK